MRDWLPPIRRREFWAVQLLVLLIAVSHFTLEVTSVDERHGALSYVPTSLYLVPVVYAALSFGLHGSLPTALWSAVLTVPNVFLFHTDSGAFGEFWQIGLVVLVGAFVGQRVDREKRARQEAESRERARRTSEEKYRGLFEHVAEPILLLGPGGAVEDANEAAGQLLGRSPDQLRGRSTLELLGTTLEGLASGEQAASPVRQLAVAGTRPRWVRPVLIPLTNDERAVTQLVLRDLTPEYERQRELEAYAGRTTQAREEERGRIARQLHDGPVQSLVLLWRRLDAMEPLDDPERDRQLRQAQRAVREAADELRRVSRDLRPSILDNLGLSSALRAEVNTFSERTGIPARLVCQGSERRLGPERELALLRIAQEALRNVGQHSQARRAAVRLQFQASRVRLSVTDDGRGVSERHPAELVAKGKLGLVGMREQARLINATIEIANGKRSGTVVSVAVDA